MCGIGTIPSGGTRAALRLCHGRRDIGGRVLLKRFAREWGLTGTTGGRFLEGYGEASGRMWQRFVAAVDGAPFDAEERAQCTEAACESFESLRRWCVQ